MKPIDLPICLSKNAPPNEEVRGAGGCPNESGEDDPNESGEVYIYPYQVSSSHFVFARRQRSCDPSSPERRKLFPAHLPFTRTRGLATSALWGVEHESLPFGPSTLCGAIVKTCQIARHW